MLLGIFLAICKENIQQLLLQEADGRMTFTTYVFFFFFSGGETETPSGYVFSLTF